jgi:hypothetical protein
MAIKIAGVTVIDDSRNWTGNPFSNSSLEYGGSQVYSSVSSTLTLNATSPQYSRIEYQYSEVVLPTASLISGGFERFVIYNKSAGTINIKDNSNALYPLKVDEFAICTAISNTWEITISNYPTPIDSLFTTGTPVVGTVNTYPRIAKLEPKKAIIAYSYVSLVRARVVSMTGSLPVVGTELSFSSCVNPGIPIINDIDSSRALVVYTHSSGFVYGIVLSISGTTVTANTETQLFIDTLGSYELIKLDSTRFLIVYNRSGLIYGRVITVSGTSISIGTEYSVSSSTTGTTEISGALISTDKVLLAFNGSSNATYTLAVSISGTVITAGTRLTIRSSNSGRPRVTKIDTDKGLIIHQWNGSISYGGYAAVANVSGTTVTIPSGAGGQYLITTNTDFTDHFEYGSISAFPSSTTKALVAYGRANARFTARTLTISGNVITVSTHTRANDFVSFAENYVGNSSVTMDNSVLWICDTGNTVVLQNFIQTNSNIN